MDLWTALQAVILGVVEGLTEFLPISSTGHQIVVADLLGFGGERAMAFNIIIQLGAILAVMWEYRRKILITVFNVPRQREAQRFTANLLIAFLPAVVIGVAFADLIHEYLFNAITVAAALIIGGLVMLWAERRQHEVTVEEVDDMTWKEALKIGFAQCLAMIPGTSRPASTIIGGLLLGCTRSVASKFTFFLAIPVMFGASALKLVKYFIKGGTFGTNEIAILGVGCVVAFVVSLIAIKWLMGFVRRHDFKCFGVYRIILGIVVLAYFFVLEPMLGL